MPVHLVLIFNKEQNYQRKEIEGDSSINTSAAPNFTCDISQLCCTTLTLKECAEATVKPDIPPSEALAPKARSATITGESGEFVCWL